LCAAGRGRFGLKVVAEMGVVAGVESSKEYKDCVERERRDEL
jgi:hypothetical protein